MDSFDRALSVTSSRVRITKQQRQATHNRIAYSRCCQNALDCANEEEEDCADEEEGYADEEEDYADDEEEVYADDEEKGDDKRASHHLFPTTFI